VTLMAICKLLKVKQVQGLQAPLQTIPTRSS
jgi:hypothetical protein